jgi:hypothetical protein
VCCTRDVCCQGAGVCRLLHGACTVLKLLSSTKVSEEENNKRIEILALDHVPSSLYSPFRRSCEGAYPSFAKRLVSNTQLHSGGTFVQLLEKTVL